MISLNTYQQNLVDSASKTVTWLFEVRESDGTYHYWSTQAIAASTILDILTLDTSDGKFDFGLFGQNEEFGRAWTARVIDFDGITLRRASSENGIQAPNDLQFVIANSSDAITGSDFHNGSVRISVAISDGTNQAVIRRWRFRIKRTEEDYKICTFFCEDFLQQYLEGEWPNTVLVDPLFPTDSSTKDDGEIDNYCQPEIFGTAYIPLRPCWVQTDTQIYYYLGDTSLTYTITKIKAPREFEKTSTWLSSSYTFTQSNKADAGATSRKVVQFIIADANNDGTPDANGVFVVGDKVLDVPCQYTKSDTASMTCPSDIIRYVLKDFGVPAKDLDDDSFATAKATFSSWSLTFNGGQWYKEDRAKVLSRLLSMCHSRLVVNDSIHLEVLVKASQKTLTTANIIKGSFNYSAIDQVQNDAAYVAFQNSGEPQDVYKKILVEAVSGTQDNISQETLEAFWVQDSQVAQKLGVLHFQRRFLQDAQMSFDAGGMCLALQPDDQITVNDTLYGGSNVVLIDAMEIRKDLSIGFECIKFSSALQDWGDLAPSAVTVNTNTTTGQYQPIMEGPSMASPDTGSQPNMVGQTLYVGSAIYMNGSGDGKLQIGTSLAQDVAFNVHDQMYFDTELVITTGAKIANWDIQSDLLRSAASGARIELDQGNKRISIFDATNSKVVMGYLNGLPKNSGVGNWGVGDYGFWARSGDKLSIDGDGEYINGDWIIQHDASYLVYDGSNNTIIRLGTDTGEKGLFLYDASANQLAKFISTGCTIGQTGANQANIVFDTTNGIRIRHQATDKMKFDMSGNAYFSGNIEVENTSAIYSTGKTSYADTDAGFFIGYDTDAYKLNLGDASSYFKWDGGAMDILVANGEFITLNGTVKVNSGGDIQMHAADANQSSIDFYNSSNSNRVGITASHSGGVLSSLDIQPTNDNDVGLYIGGSGSQRYSLIETYCADNYLVRSGSSPSNYSDLKLENDQAYIVVSDSSYSPQFRLVGSSGYAWLQSHSRFGVGTATPDCFVHMFESSAGSVSAVANTVLCVENSATAYISILAPTQSGLFFGDVAANTDGGIVYVHSTPKMAFKVNNAYEMDLTSTTLAPRAASGLSLGDATYYWNDVSYKTLTDRGCIPHCDSGVELQNGDIVSDLAALEAIKKHPTKLTIYGLPRLDYKTMPKCVYRPAMMDGKLLPRDENDEPYYMATQLDEDGTQRQTKVAAEDGAETTHLLGIMLGSIKEVAATQRDIIKRLSVLEGGK